jgi:hypothetical protein
MIAVVPFMMSALAFGVTALIIFLAANIILTIPIFATRGRTQAIWFGVVSVLMLAIGATLVVLTVLVSQDKIL